jgi:uncharacterized protein
VAKLNKAQRHESDEIPAADVEAYLRRHPDFFSLHLDLLETLKLPHPCGEAVSLVTRQIDLLRERNRRLQLQLNDILQIARDNDALARRIHQLTLSLLDATSLDDGLAGLRWLLHECFQADFVAVRLLQPIIDSPIADLCLPPDCSEISHFQNVLESGKPECGEPTQEQTALLFGELAEEVRSIALVPLQHAGLKGLLAIGSRNSSRFEAGMGHHFLMQMGEIVAARFVSLLAAQPER